MEAFRQCINCRFDRTLQKVYISLQISHKVFIGPAASIIYTQKSGFSFKLFKQFMELIVMVGSNFLDGCKKYCWIGM